MSTPKIRLRLFVGLSALICLAATLSGCTQFDGIVDFAAIPTSGKQPLSVQFTPAVEGSVRRWIWSFGDGHTSTDRSPEHTYESPGTYTVLLTVVPRHGDPTSVMKADYITVQSGFGDGPTPLAVQDDFYMLGEPGGATSYVDPYGDTVYVLDVLENDNPGDGASEVWIIGVKAYESDEYDDFEAITGSGNAMINREGTAIEYEPFLSLSDTFYYLATDGQTIAEAEVSISYFDDGDHAP